jgi:hypothetical protein
MKDSEFKLLEPIADLINDRFDELHKAGAFDEVLLKIKTAIRQLPDTYSVSLDIRMHVFDMARENGINLLNTGINCQKGNEPYRHYADSAPQKYLVDGDICNVLDDYCPHCWGEWGFKFRNPTCPECGYRLGEEVKYVLDDDTCPYCGDGKITMDKPICDKCGFEVDGKKVVWG